MDTGELTWLEDPDADCTSTLYCATATRGGFLRDYRARSGDWLQSSGNICVSSARFFGDGGRCLEVAGAGSCGDALGFAARGGADGGSRGGRGVAVQKGHLAWVASIGGA